MGCRLHEFPYTVKSIIPVKKKYPKIKFENEDDVWNYLWDLEEESNKIQNKGNGDIIADIYHQLPFFACKNVFLDRKMQKYIDMYIYCKETGTQAYKGCYGDQPKKWTDYYFIINQAMEIRKTIQKDDYEREQKLKKRKKKGN